MKINKINRAYLFNWHLLNKSLAVIGLAFILFAFPSCKSYKLQVDSVGYQSMTTTNPEKQDLAGMPSNSRILLTFAINQEGAIVVMVNNLTNEIMTIDQQLSFLIDTDGASRSYYDNTIHATTSTQYNFSTDSFSMNLGSLASAFGVGGRLGTLLGGMNVGNSSTTGFSNATTTIMQDEKRINIGPHGSSMMSKVFPIKGVGCKAIKENFPSTDYKFLNLNQNSSPLVFQVCISYSFNNGASFSRLDTKFYIDSMFSENVPDKQRTGDAMRKMMLAKPNLLGEPWYLISINNNIHEDIKKKGSPFAADFFTTTKVYDFIVNGLLFNYE